MSFTKPQGKGQIILSVAVVDRGNFVQVRTTASYGGGLALKGLQEEYLQNFHVVLFRSLNITDPSERNIHIEVAK
jgi:hypothetical protein